MRKRLPPPPPSPHQTETAEPVETQAASEPQATASDDNKPAAMSRRIRWAQLIKRVFKKDLETCPHCGGRRVLIAFITDAPVVHKILSHVGLPTDTPPVAAARAPPQLVLDDDDDWPD